MHHARSFLSGCAALVCLALLRPHLAAAYQQTDLQGTWEFNSIASGPGQPWWERARATVAAGGSFTAFANDNTGGADTIQSAFALSPTGIVTVAGSSTFLGTLDPGTTVLVSTDTWSSGSPGTTQMQVGVKMVGGYGLADLAGAWEVNTIASGPGAPWWERGRVAVAADGSFSGTLTDNADQPDPVSAAFSITPGGLLTFSGSNTGRGVMDAGKSVFVMTSTWTGFMAGTVDLTVGVKVAASYTLADLAGTWEIHSLATGPGAPWWSRGQITVAGNGSFAGSTSSSSGGGGPISGTFGITPGGVITRSGSLKGRGVLDAGKSVMVWTDVWNTGSPGTTEILVATRTSGGTAAVGGVAGLEFALEPVHPNPMRGRAPTVRFVLPSAAPAQLELLDVSGRRLAEQEVGSLGAGRHTRNLGERRRLEPGVYLVRLRQGSITRVTRVVVL